MMIHNSKARTTARLAIGLYLATLISLIVTTFYPAPPEGVSVALMLSVKLVPLLVFAGAVFKASNRGLIWLSVVLTFYFTQYAVSAWLSEGEIAPVLLSVLTFSLFTVAMFHLKVNRSSAAPEH